MFKYLLKAFALISNTDVHRARARIELWGKMEEKMNILNPLLHMVPNAPDA